MRQSYMAGDEYTALKEYWRTSVWFNEHGWKYQATRRPMLRAALAKALVALATRIAPTVTPPHPSTPSLAQ